MTAMAKIDVKIATETLSEVATHRVRASDRFEEMSKTAASLPDNSVS